MRLSHALRLIPGLLLLTGAVLDGCAVKDPGVPPPSDRLYYPTGVAFVPGGAGGQGTVYVASSNFDLRFHLGTLSAIDVASLGLNTDAGTTAVHDPLGHVASQVLIDNFGGPLAVMQVPGTGPAARRLFVASRASNVLEAIDVDGTTMSCPTNPGDTNCFTHAVSLHVDEQHQVRDAYRPVVANGRVWVSHLSVMDTPKNSGQDRFSALASVDPLTLQPPEFVGIGLEASDGLASVDGLLYLGGRATSGDANDEPLRRIDLLTSDFPVLNLPIRAGAYVYDTRGMALSSDGSRLYMVTRTPDALVTLDMSLGLDGLPKEQVLGVAQLPKGPTEVAVIPRGPGRHDLVAITCATDNSVALYDDDLGQVVAAVQGGGESPFGVAVDATAPGRARLFVTSFGRGALSVVDIPDLDDARTASVLGVFGPNQNCLNDVLAARPPECP
jgi:hypothetical protein